MEVDKDDLNLKSRLRDVLQDAKNPISYGSLARDLAVPGPGAIARVTTALEAMMLDDMEAGRPFVAAMCEGKLANGLPAKGFFQTAHALGRYSGPDNGPEAAAFVDEQRAFLKNQHSVR